MESVFTSAGKNTSDILGHVLKVPFVNKTIDLSGFLIAFVVGICIINDTYKTNTPNGKKAVDVFFNQFKFSGKPRLGLTKNDIELMCLCISEKPFELRSVAIRTGIVIIAINVKQIPTLADRILHQHCFLILNTIAIVFFVCLIPIFFGKTAVDCYFHCSISFVTEQAI